MAETKTAPPDGYKPTELGPLPEEWKVVRLGEVALKTKQFDPKKNPDRRFKYVDVSAVSSESLTVEGYVEHVGRDAPSRARKQVQLGDVIFATVRPYLRRVAVVPPELDGQVCSTAFCVIRARPGIADPEFLFFSSSTDDFVRRISEHQRGSSYPAVSDKDVLNELIPLPPLPEQRDIARVLGMVQEAREATEQVIASARELKRSLMRHLFTYGPVPVEEAEQVPLKETEVGPVPEPWEVVKLGEVSRLFQYGTSERCNTNGRGDPVLRIPNVLSGEINPYDLKYAELPEKTASKLRLSVGDLLFVRTNGRRKYVGRCAMFRGEPGEALFASYLIRTQLDKGTVLPEFVQYYTATSGGRKWLSGRASEAADGKYNLNTQILKDVSLPLPPVADQQEIICALSAVDEKIAAEENRKRSLEVLFKTLLRDLMTGKLRVEDAAETAS